LSGEYNKQRKERDRSILGSLLLLRSHIHKAAKHDWSQDIFNWHQLIIPSQTFCYWDKQQSTDNIIIQFYLTLQCMVDQSSHFSHCFLAPNWNFHHHDPGVTKFHAEFQQPMVCVVINNSHYPAVKNNNPTHPAFGKYWMQAWGLLNYRLKFCWLKLICCLCQSNELEREIKHTTGGDKLGPAQNLGAVAQTSLSLQSPLASVAPHIWKKWRTVCKRLVYELPKGRRIKVTKINGKRCVYWKRYPPDELKLALWQGWANSGPRAKRDPPQRFQWPAEAFRKIFKSEISSHFS